MTLSPTDTLVCDTTQLAVWQSDADYNYNRELIAPEVNIFEWLNRWFGEILQSIFGSQFAEDYSKTILISVAVLMLLLIGWFIYKKNSGNIHTFPQECFTLQCGGRYHLWS